MQRASGVSLLELLLCLALLAVLVSLSLPGLGGWVRAQAAATAVRTFADAIALARLTAVTGNQLVTLCRSSDGASCGGNWERGALLFLDRNGDAAVDSGDEIVRYFQPPSGVAIRWRAFPSRSYLQFTPLGVTRWQNGNFTFCADDAGAAGARQLIVTATGRARVALDNDGDGWREDANGDPIDCSWALLL